MMSPIIRRSLITLMVTLFVLLLVCLGILPIALVDIVAGLMLGWIFYLARVVPQTHVSIVGVVTAVVCMIALVMLGHGMARWLWREMKAAPPAPWRRRWTFSMVAIVVLMFAAGIGAVGVTHQSVWLLKSDQPLVQMSSWVASRMKCGSNMRQIGQALQLYADDHEHHLPDTLNVLLTTEDITPEVFVCPNSDDYEAQGATPQEQAASMGDGSLSYIYYGRGLSFPLPADQVILSEPLIDHEGEGMNVLYGDGHVEWLSAPEARQVLGALGR